MVFILMYIPIYFPKRYAKYIKCGLYMCLYSIWVSEYYALGFLDSVQCLDPKILGVQVYEQYWRSHTLSGCLPIRYLDSVWLSEY